MVIMEDNEECCVVPPGFRFHPTEEELVGYYLARKVASPSSHKMDDVDIIIPEVDLYRMEPWDLLQQRNKYNGGGDECYFFSHKDRKYPSGTRTNRATAAGFWKATGRDKPVLSSISSAAAAGGSGRVIIGMRKTLVFYKGRAPNGRKTEWIMHEYRLHSHSDNLLLPPQQQEEGWVVCRAFQKPIPNQQQLYHHHHHHPGSSGYTVDDDHRFFLGSSTASSVPLMYRPQERSEIFPHQLYSTATNNNNHDDLFESKNKQHLLLSIPRLIDSPTAAVDDIQQEGGGEGAHAATGAIDWNFLDTLLLSSSTLLHDHPSSS